MASDQSTFEQAQERLEEIVVQVREKDASLEDCLDLLEEGVELANQCTERIDHTKWRDEEGLDDDAEAQPIVDGAPGEEIVSAASDEDEGEDVAADGAGGASDDSDDVETSG